MSIVLIIAEEPVTMKSTPRSIDMTTTKLADEGW